MKIILNHQEEHFEQRDSLTVKELLDLKKYSFKLLVIKINGLLVPRNEYSKARVNDLDEVIILHLMSGG